MAVTRSCAGQMGFPFSLKGEISVQSGDLLQGIPRRRLATNPAANGTAAARSLLFPLVIHAIWVAGFEGIKKNLPSYNLAFYFFICTVHCTAIVVFTIGLPQSGLKPDAADLPFHFHGNCRKQQSYPGLVTHFRMLTCAVLNTCRNGGCVFERRLQAHCQPPAGPQTARPAPQGALHTLGSRPDARRTMGQKHHRSGSCLSSLLSTMTSFASVQPVCFS